LGYKKWVWGVHKSDKRSENLVRHAGEALDKKSRTYQDGKRGPELVREAGKRTANVGRGRDHKAAGTGLPRGRIFYEQRRGKSSAEFGGTTGGSDA